MAEKSLPAYVTRLNSGSLNISRMLFCHLLLVNMPHCNISSHNCQGISYFVFPQSSSLCKKWIHLCDREVDWKPRKDDRICSSHFALEDFQQDLQVELLRTRPKLKLKGGSFPTHRLSHQHAVSFTLPPATSRAVSKLEAARAVHDMSTAT